MYASHVIIKIFSFTPTHLFVEQSLAKPTIANRVPLETGNMNINADKLSVSQEKHCNNLEIMNWSTRWSSIISNRPITVRFHAIFGNRIVWQLLCLTIQTKRRSAYLELMEVLSIYGKTSNHFCQQRVSSLPDSVFRSVPEVFFHVWYTHCWSTQFLSKWKLLYFALYCQRRDSTHNSFGGKII